MRPPSRRCRPIVILAAACLLALTGCTPTRAGAEAKPAYQPSPIKLAPNIVFILTDDLSWNLVQYMPHVLELEKTGVTFTNYTVTDSLCCPSRSSIFTGDYPHDTGVFTNHPPDGGFDIFHARGDETKTYATALYSVGYVTALMGKYLNGYLPADKDGGKKPYVPPGWAVWDAAGNAYPEFNYSLNEDHKVVHYGGAPADYLTDVLSRKGSAFIEREAVTNTPFSLEIATFAPHAPQVPAPADANSFPGLTAPRDAAFDTVPQHAPSWLAGEAPLTAYEEADINAQFRRRVQSVQAVDRLVASIQATLKASHVANNTYFVFSSDNGFHMGEYRLTPGKQTAFDTDIRVPLIVAGPGVPADSARDEVVQNVDLAPTFEQLAGAHIPSTVEGHSLVPLLGGQLAPDWRTAALVEHHGPNSLPGDPDAQTARNGDPITYEALRTATYTYVEYANGEREYYDRVKDPDELDNIAGQLSATRLAALHDALQRLHDCHNQQQCWAAGHVTI